jgi:hypothetical protein
VFNISLHFQFLVFMFSVLFCLNRINSVLFGSVVFNIFLCFQFSVSVFSVLFTFDLPMFNSLMLYSVNFCFHVQ